jgi:Icc-related predicted phosphoesterase
MIILHTSDIHFDKTIFEEILSLQNDVDVICISGDFLKEINDEEISYIKNGLKI